MRFRCQQTEEKQNNVVIVPDNLAILVGNMKNFTALFNRLYRRLILGCYTRRVETWDCGLL